MNKTKSIPFALAVALALQFCASPKPAADGITTAATETTATAISPASVASSSRVDSLIAAMTIEEKVGQMTQVTIDLILEDDETTVVDMAKLRKALIEKNVGSILNVKGHAYTVDEWHKILTTIQDVATKETRLGVPVVYGVDAIHGANYIAGSTLFPHNIGTAASRNPEMARKIAEITAAEVRAAGIPWNFDPVLDIGRQPLWPRFEETFGEDVYLVKTMGAATIRGYEQDGLNQDHTVASCMKHFLGYSLPATGKDRTPSYIPETMLREYVLPPFREAVEAGAATVMINSGEINGVPVHGSKYYLTTILRDELGFEGVAVSDWEDVIRLHTRHRVAATPKEAVRMAVEAGLDMSMVPMDYSFYDLLVELVKEGTISEERIDLSVRRILNFKENLGLLDNPYPNAALKSQVQKPEYDSVAYQAALESLTLLKNEGNVLPLKKGARVLVAGPGANSLGTLHSSWSYIWQGSDESQYPDKALTIVEALRKELGAKNVVSRSVGDFGAAANYNVAQLKKDAQNVQAIILCLGEKAYAESPGVIDDLGLDANQLTLAKAAKETGKPVILVLTQGRPRIISSIEPDVKAVLLAYRPSTFGAPAIADVLFGDHNPSGVLPFTYPRHAGDVVLYDHKGTEKIREDQPNTYGDKGFNPQWTFGHGLSYTTFQFSDLKVNATTFGANDQLQVTVKVKNTGSRAGKKAVELYSRDLYASITPSASRLRAYTKVDLAPGEEKEVRFSLKPEDLAFVNEAGKWVTEPGDFDLMVGDLKVTTNYVQ
ncbi:glycoside hydrolase family 3 N-terminal domain-containing protein [Pontibacter akesuensis]|uniref:beta-glucosidase n=1 Tax=Pontibacter akesuensis TaxID=388950 RepID=A0A1I7KXH1_9BACT|nr:glycoside hydrolase family 3 N-terminal domain-containing protein [Pontibacter akesuensis]GHA78526.1 glycosyl hydrolase [Pontibacter akesuensis]SFV02130.1 beta-glucosidase [Pontibacter akesuensis]